MTYRVYIGPRGERMAAPIDKDKMPFKQFDHLHEALGWARHMAAEGRSVLQIEGDDGTMLSHHDIAAALQEGGQEVPARRAVSG